MTQLDTRTTLPAARGALSSAVLAVFEGQAPHTVSFPTPEHPEDAQLSLWLLYELCYRGFPGVPAGLEWDPYLLTLRRGLEDEFEGTLRSRFDPPNQVDDLAEDLFAYIEGFESRSVSRFVHRAADREQVLRLLRVRSIYHLKESDHVSWLIPRLGTVPKAALMEVQFDEYGGGNPNRLHAHLFARGMQACGLDPEENAYVDEAPVEVLEQNNAMSLFGLHRRLRGAAMGHFAAFEATSSQPSRRVSQGLQRLGFPAEMIAYFDEHVEADAVHEQLAIRAVVVPMVEEDPSLVDDVFLGAFTCMDLEDRFAGRMLTEFGQ
jgi:Iron-containing redox enzyme